MPPAARTLTGLLALLASPVAFADDAAPVEATPVPVEAPIPDAALTDAVAESGSPVIAEVGVEPAPVVAAPRHKLDIAFHGFAELIGRGDLTAGTLDFSVQQAEIDLIGDWNDVVFFRTDLQYDAYYFDASSPVGFLGSFVEQAVVDVQVYKKAALKFGVGRFNAPMGFEAIDPLDRPIGSYSQVFNYLDPFLLTGARVSGAVGWFDFVAWVSQGYEVIVDNNTDKTFGGRVGFRPNDAATIGLAAAYGSEYADNAHRRLNVALDYTLTPTDKLLIGGEVTLRQEEGNSQVDAGEDGRALGVLLEAAYRFHPFFGLAVRGDTIQDFDGIIWGQQMQTYSWSVAPTVHLFDHARIQLEYKGYAASTPFFSTSSPTPDAPTTSPTASQLYQSMNLFNGAGTAASMSHMLALQVIGNF
jgi:hypothetical protein